MIADIKHPDIICGLIVAALIFIMIGHVYREQVQLRLKREIIRVPEASLDWWSVSHFGLFFLFGMVEPHRHLTFFTLGAAFEVVEDMLSADDTTQLVNCKFKQCNSYLTNKVFCNGFNEDYWYGKWDDVFVNILGYTLGSGIRSTLYYDDDF